MADKIQPDEWICERCDKRAYGLEWKGWIQLPKDWFMCKLTITGEQQYFAVACSEECMRKVDEKLAEKPQGDA